MGHRSAPWAALLTITAQFTLWIAISVVPGTAHCPILIHKPKQRSGATSQKGLHVHALKLATAPRDGNGRGCA